MVERIFTFDDSLVTKRDLDFIVKKLSIVKKAGWGKLEIIIQDGKIVYATLSIGEQVKMNLETEK